VVCTPVNKESSIRMFNKKHTGITIVHNDTLFFLSATGHALQVDHSLPLTAFLEGNTEGANLPPAVLNRTNRLLIVPDYWIGQADMRLPSQKRSIVEAFVERKLIAEYTDLPDIGLFYGYALASQPADEGRIHAFFLQEPQAYELYNKLQSINAAPNDITAPAYIWEQKLIKMAPDAVSTGVALVQKQSLESYLYFYHQGKFLFSRSIQFSTLSSESAEALQALTYEINQSVYLFSQKKKTELELIFMHSDRKEDAAELAENLGRDVRTVTTNATFEKSGPEIEHTLGPCSDFNRQDVAPSACFSVIAQKHHGRARAWRPIQTAGIMIGFLLILILGGEHVYLLKWSQLAATSSDVGWMTAPNYHELMDRYNASLDVLLQETQTFSASATLLTIARCLPDNVRVSAIQLSLSEAPVAALSCIVRAENMAVFRETLTELINNLGSAFEKSPRLEKQDVELGEIVPGKGYIDYPVQFQVRLI
jgi:hypothetical protein